MIARSWFFVINKEMTILDKIILQKRAEIAQWDRKKRYEIYSKSEYVFRPKNSLTVKMEASIYPQFICEFKRKSPSKQDINLLADLEKTIESYAYGGAAAISVLTDEKFFGGSMADLQKARSLVSVPILCKDFMIDEIQVLQAKAAGADIILIIVAALDMPDAIKIAKMARTLDMEILLELHSEQELCYMDIQPDFVGINNRNLRTFEVDLDRSIHLAEKIPNRFIKIAESGISKPEQVAKLYAAGFRTFLMGEYFMRQADSELALREFILKSQKLCS